MSGATLTIGDYQALVSAFEAEAMPAIAGADSVDALEAVRAKHLGRAHGWLRTLSARLGELDRGDRAAAGRAFNEVRVRVEDALAERQQTLAPAREGGALADPTMPARHSWAGVVHPVSQVLDEMIAIFRELGFTIALGPETESPWYNFGALNFPADHPAMDLHDTLYVSDDVLLRTHTSPVQVRTLQAYPPPIRVLIPGNVHRRDPFDASHAPAFTQVEGLVVDEGIGFADLKATLNHFARRFFGAAKTRFRPSYFPFTEPSAEMDVVCGVCNGSGCGVCKQTGWIEILGSGLVHPAVLESAGVDSERYTGWAFGMGPGRTALARHGIPDIRILYDSDVRFLGQFSR
ncbi:MAG: phenylalanine--tRNA ligase subunit alpha [Gemmatimonadaceae bacterium]|nr:phenylalanine--tRNA ligase subunit alpha [Gemmatimonadaceae bacterium]